MYSQLRVFWICGAGPRLTPESDAARYTPCAWHRSPLARYRGTRMKLAHLLSLVLGLGAGWFGGSTSLMDAVTPTSPTASSTPSDQARYRATFRATWSQATHPDRFPSNPHFSPLVGATHSLGIRFWEAGAIASGGMEQMAELGATSPLESIIGNAIDAGQAQSFLLGGGINPAPGEASVELTVTREFPYVTLVAMIAPSPDWFVGVSAHNLFESGDWPLEVVVELFPYDAGTDGGDIYNAADSDTDPQEPITRIDGPPFRDEGVDRSLGTFTFTRIPT